MEEKLLNYQKVEEAFQKYVSKFDTKDKNIMLKIRHSYEVEKLSGDLAKRLYFTDDEVTLARIIGLLHDIGRFEQIKKTGSFSDKKIDHGLVAIDYLFKNNMHIKDFISDRFYDDIIRNAIYYHNKIDIPSDKGVIATKFMKLIRDADKIAVFYQNAVDFDLVFQERPSIDVLTIFKEEELIPIKYVHSKSDHVLYTLAYLFDINYEESFDLLVETDYLGIFIGSVDVSEELEEEWKEIRQIIYNKVERGI